MGLRILLLNYEYPPAGGGAGNATCNIAKQLVQMGQRVDVLTAQIDEDDVDGEIVDGVRVWRVPSWRKGIHDCGLIGAYSWVAYAAWRRRKLVKERDYDLEHFFFSLPTGVLTCLPFSGSSLPYVVSLRGSDVPGYDPFNEKLEVMHRFLRPVTRRIWRRARTVVSLSDGLTEIAHRTAPKQRIELIPNGIDTDVFKPAAGPRAPSPSRRLRVVSVARLLERKGIHHLLEAIARPTPLPVDLKVIGTGSYETELRRRCTELGIDDRVEFAGFVRRDRLPEHYGEADVFALPSLTEAFGLVFAEAMACRLPIVSTNVGGIPALVRNGVDGLLVDPGCVMPLRGALTKMIEDPAARKSMAASALHRIETEYTWEITARRYLACYRRALQVPDPKCVASPAS